MPPDNSVQQVDPNRFGRFEWPSAPFGPVPVRNNFIYQRWICKGYLLANKATHRESQQINFSVAQCIYKIHYTFGHIRDIFRSCSAGRTNTLNIEDNYLVLLCQAICNSGIICDKKNSIFRFIKKAISKRNFVSRPDSYISWLRFFSDKDGQTHLHTRLPECAVAFYTYRMAGWNVLKTF